MPLLIEIAKSYGWQVAIIAWFAWRDYKREQDMNRRIRELENYIQNELTEALKKTTSVLERFIAMLNTRPCIADEEIRDRILRGQ